LPKKKTGHRRRGRRAATREGEKEHSRQIETERVETGSESEGRTPRPWPVARGGGVWEGKRGRVSCVRVFFQVGLEKKETLVGLMGYSCGLDC
jgi:hypothetical protein